MKIVLNYYSSGIMYKLLTFRINLKILPVLNSTPRHEGMLEEWRYSSTRSSPWHKMEVSGQLYAPAALSPG